MEAAMNVEWPDRLDALVAAPDHHEVLFENDKVRVLDSRVPSGGATPVHTHRWPAVLYIIGESDFIRYDPQGNVIFDSRNGESTSNVGKAIWSPPLTPHYVKNVGDGEIRVISVEIKE